MLQHIRLAQIELVGADGRPIVPQDRRHGLANVGGQVLGGGLDDGVQRTPGGRGHLVVGRFPPVFVEHRHVSVLHGVGVDGHVVGHGMFGISHNL